VILTGVLSVVLICIATKTMSNFMSTLRLLGLLIIQ